MSKEERIPRVLRNAKQENFSRSYAEDTEARRVCELRKQRYFLCVSVFTVRDLLLWCYFFLQPLESLCEVITNHKNRFPWRMPNPEVFLEVIKMANGTMTFEEVFTKAGIIPQ